MVNNSREGVISVRFPKQGASPTEYLAYRDRFFNYTSSFRRNHMQRMALALHYKLGRQWIEPDYSLSPTASGFSFKDITFPGDDYYYFPRPVANYITSSADVEISSLGMREMYPKVVTKNKDPRIEAAAKVGQRVLDDRLRKLSWPEQRDELIDLFVVMGTGIIKSYWDETWTDLTKIGSPSAMACPECPNRFASGMIEREHAGVINGNAVKEEATEEGLSLSLQACPECGGELQKYQVSEEELEDTDYFGRKMGIDVPKGNTGLEVISPFDFFPGNGGVDVDPRNMSTWGQLTIRSMDWIHDRYPDKVDKIIPAGELTNFYLYHPILASSADLKGSYFFSGRFHNQGIYDNHVWVYELYSKPSYEHPEGRMVVMAQDETLEDGPLMVGIDRKVEKVKYGIARFKPRHREFWGHGLLDDLIPLQNRLNGLDAQLIDSRERMGSPNIMATQAMNLSGPEWFEGYGGGKILRFEPDPLSPNQTPTVMQGTGMYGDIWREREAVINDFQKIAGPQDIELGEAPRNVTTTSGLQLLNEEAKRRRGPRSRSLSEMFKDIWEHQLHLMWALRVDPDDYEYKNAEDEWEMEQYTREALDGQTKVQVETQTYIDHSIYQNEATREALADGLIRLDSQAAIKKVLEMRGLPTEINEDLNREVDLSKRQWTDFLMDGTIPVIDTTLDDFLIHYNTIGTLMKSDEGKNLEKQVGWSSIMHAITGWEEDLQRAEMMDAQAVAFYGGRLSPEQAQPLYEQAQQAFMTQQQAYEQSQQASQGQIAAGADPSMIPPAMPPQPPPPPIFLPAAKADRIFMVWQQKLQQTQHLTAMHPPSSAPMLPEPDEPQIQVESFIKFRAVVDAYRLLAQEKAMQMVPQLPTPGTPEGNPGMGGAMPGVQQPPNPPTPGSSAAANNQVGG